jgi:hypothetical protein
VPTPLVSQDSYSLQQAKRLKRALAALSKGQKRHLLQQIRQGGIAPPVTPRVTETIIKSLKL